MSYAIERIEDRRSVAPDYNNRFRGSASLRCDECGSWTTVIFHLRNHRGDTMRVGQVCAVKHVAPLAVMRQSNTLKRAHLWRARGAEFAALVEQHESLLRSLPHPAQVRADNGETFFDWAKWVERNAYGRLEDSLQRLRMVVS